VARHHSASAAPRADVDPVPRAGPPRGRSAVNASSRAAFPRVAGRLHCEGVALEAIAREHGTPVFVYSRAAIEDAYGRYASALEGRDALVCYAMKANSSRAVLELLARRGAGFDIVSGGELARALRAGASASRIVFSGVGKTEPEMEAALRAGILAFHVESADELETLAAVAQRISRRAPVALRVNPDVDALTHRYISTGKKANKFGVDIGAAPALYRRAASHPWLEIVGVACHIGSQITRIEPYVSAAERVLDLVDELARDGIALRQIDLGGGLGIPYAGENVPAPADLVQALLGCLDRRGRGAVRILLEPGRSIVGAAGALVARVLSVKAAGEKSFAIVDAAMNDLLRPALYEAWMDVVPVGPGTAKPVQVDVVGPVCESGDWIARDRSLAVEAGDLLAVLDCGAYAMAMASNYNSRGRAAEVMVDGASVHLVRRREAVEDLLALEKPLPPA